MLMLKSSGRSCSVLLRTIPRPSRCLTTTSLTVSRDKVTVKPFLIGKGSSHVRSTSTTIPISGTIPVATKWVSPSEDDIQVTDKPEEMTEGSVEFSSFPLSEEILEKLRSMGCTSTFEIQAKTLPLTLNGRDVIGRAVTGSGKTLAFALPIVHSLSNSPRTRQPRAIVIAPTRELCNQVYTSIQFLSSDIRCVALYGGAPYYHQESALLEGVDVICATPGRLNDHLERRNFSLESVQFLVLDEADELLTPNFKVQIENILEDCPSSKQMMLFSATLPPDIKAITKKYMKDAEVVDLVTDRNLIPEAIVHEFIQTIEWRKMSIVTDLLLENQPKRALVFAPRKTQTHVLANKLSQVGFKAAALNSDMSQNSRDYCFSCFKKGEIDVLVATDVAARGLDVPEIDLVVQVELPPNGVDFYIHRSGRTGRMGQPGKTILIHSGDRNSLEYFLRDLKRNNIKLSMIRPPSGKKVTENLLKETVAKLDPATLSKEALDITLPYATELMEKFGVEALATALASLSNIQSRLDHRYESNYDNASRKGGRLFNRTGRRRSFDREQWRDRGDRDFSKRYGFNDRRHGFEDRRHGNDNGSFDNFMSGVYGGGNWKDRVNRDDWKGGWQERRSFGRGRKYEDSYEPSSYHHSNSDKHSTNQPRAGGMEWDDMDD